MTDKRPRLPVIKESPSDAEQSLDDKGTEARGQADGASQQHPDGAGLPTPDSSPSKLPREKRDVFTDSMTTKYQSLPSDDNEAPPKRQQSLEALTRSFGYESSQKTARRPVNDPIVRKRRDSQADPPLRSSRRRAAEAAADSKSQSLGDQRQRHYAGPEQVAPPPQSIVELGAPSTSSGAGLPPPSLTPPVSTRAPKYAHVYSASSRVRPVSSTSSGPAVPIPQALPYRDSWSDPSPDPERLRATMVRGLASCFFGSISLLIFFGVFEALAYMYPDDNVYQAMVFVFGILLILLVGWNCIYYRLPADFRNRYERATRRLLGQERTPLLQPDGDSETNARQ